MSEYRGAIKELVHCRLHFGDYKALVQVINQQIT